MGKIHIKDTSVNHKELYEVRVWKRKVNIKLKLL